VSGAARLPVDNLSRFLRFFKVGNIDTGISASFGVHPSALEIKNGDAWAIYPSGRVDLPDPK